MASAATAARTQLQQRHEYSAAMASPKDKNEEEILERIAALYGQLDDIRDQRREVHTVGTEDGPRVVLVTSTTRGPSSVPTVWTSRR